MSDPRHDQNAPVSDGLRIAQRRVEAALILTVAGEIDLRTAPALRDAVQAALADPASSVCVVDLTEVVFLGSAGLAALVEASDHAQRRREPLRIVVDANQPVIRPIEVTGLDHLFALYHTVDEALAAGR